MDRNGMVPHSWLKKCMMMFPVAENMQKVLVKNSMENWKTELRNSEKKKRQIPRDIIITF